MRIQGLKNLNITLLFSDPLNHLSFTQDDIIKLFKTGDQQKDLFNFIGAPELKVVIFPNQKKDIAFEKLYIKLNDKSGVEIEKSILIDDLRKILDSSFIDQSKIIAYGFNYDILVELDNGNNLIGSKISKIPDINIINAGINISFEKDKLTHVLTITPMGQEKMFVVHFNTHFNSNKIPKNNVLKKQISAQFKEFKKILKNL